MRRVKHHYISSTVMDKAEVATEEFLDGKLTPEQLMAKLKELMPVHKTDSNTWKARVEGLFEVSEMLFQAVLDKGQQKHGEEWNRSRVVLESKMRPFSYYHWVVGSREPVNNVLTRDDYLNDPTTALVKLEDDILSLARLFLTL